jgi:hypothetical protein
MRHQICFTEGNMKVKKIDILSSNVLMVTDAVCFTANGIVKNNGALTMGAGNAKEFRDTFPGLDLKAGVKVKKNGNVCQIVHDITLWHTTKRVYIISFPTKHHWRNSSDLELIKKSAKELVKIADENKFLDVYLPCPGIGMGNLKFEDVVALLSDILDDRFTICIKG